MHAPGVPPVQKVAGMKKVYICDRMACCDFYGGPCPDDELHECRHTAKMAHALNRPRFNPFAQVGDILFETDGHEDEDAGPVL